MRTTVSISDELLAAAKRRARERGQSLGAVIEDALRRELAAAPDSKPRPKVPIFHGTGPRPGLELTSNRALAEVLDEGLDLNRRR
ncbi:ribbon-helix-helix protein, CopG family [Mycobacterium branderi]|uniref:Antitoxin n=1 Tax=Mycobacterium branderi TaxID=43348 RepID=A0A7I7W236_9MYCO|nr:ribbon-helix-helix protein, CopG family [Mycobacterium branderi]MCV7233742.1 ribbon-helix-helix protein, CopG family [Mycobacterium branderi]ORA37978.1 antitoxin [Mycobacterium branderi]BBZ11002.1 antitoxin VapB31 [Mycobacterium branderi]